MEKPGGATIDAVVDSYRTFLARNRYFGHLEAFKQRLKSDGRAAEAEAIVFSFLWSARLRPDIFEDLSKGGPDFCCGSGETKFLVEVTSLESGAVARKSLLPEKIEGTGGGAFSLITPLLKAKASGKAAQFGEWPLPRVLAITSSHACAGLLMDRLGAEFLLLSDPLIRVPHGSVSDRATQVTNLQRSVFFRPSKSGQEIIPCRRSISVILLVAISGAQSDVVGVLHPDPAVLFPQHLLPQIPCLQVRHWPIVDGRIETAWSVDKPDHATFWHARIC